MKNTVGNRIFLIFLCVAASLPAFAVRNADALCVKDERANLRGGPGLKHEKLWQVYKYMPFKELGKKGDWYRVKDLDGDKYWIFGKLVTSDYHCAVVKKDQTNLRAGPGTKFAKVPWSPVKKYFSMKVLKIKDNWVKIEDGVGDTAWIYRPLVWIQ